MEKHTDLDADLLVYKSGLGTTSSQTTIDGRTPLYDLVLTGIFERNVRSLRVGTLDADVSLDLDRTAKKLRLLLRCSPPNNTPGRCDLETRMRWLDISFKFTLLIHFEVYGKEIEHQI